MSENGQTAAGLLDELEALRAAATPGAWGTPVAPTWIHRADAIGHIGTIEHAADAALIVAVVNNAPRLVAALRRVAEIADELSSGIAGSPGPGVVAQQIRSAVAAALTDGTPR